MGYSSDCLEQHSVLDFHHLDPLDLSFFALLCPFLDLVSHALDFEFPDLLLFLTW